MTATATDDRATRPAADEYAPYYGTYVSRVGDGDIVRTMKAQIGPTAAFLREIPESRGGHRYAAGKWSIREVIGHLSDAERIFTYRALRFARHDATPLPGFDENAFVANAHLDERSLGSLVDEYEAVRNASVAMFGNFFPDEWRSAGEASGKRMSVRALAWVIAGHELHHVGVLRERYL